MLMNFLQAIPTDSFGFRVELEEKLNTGSYTRYRGETLKLDPDVCPSLKEL